MDNKLAYRIDFHRLSPGQHRFEFPLGPGFFEQWPESEIAAGTGDVHIVLTKGASILELEVAIDAVVQIPCDRCLEPFDQPIAFRGTPVVRISDHPGEDDGELLWVSPQEQTLDLAQYIYESIVLSLPIQRVHPSLEECNADMLARFKIVSQEEFDALNHDADEQTPFEALKEQLEAPEK